MFFLVVNILAKNKQYMCLHYWNFTLRRVPETLGNVFDENCSRKEYLTYTSHLSGKQNFAESQTSGIR